VREGVPLMRHIFYGDFAQAGLKSPFRDQFMSNVTWNHMVEITQVETFKPSQAWEGA